MIKGEPVEAQQVLETTPITPENAAEQYELNDFSNKK